MGEDQTGTWKKGKERAKRHKEREHERNTIQWNPAPFHKLHQENKWNKEKENRKM